METEPKSEKPPAFGEAVIILAKLYGVIAVLGAVFTFYGISGHVDGSFAERAIFAAVMGAFWPATILPML